MSDERPYLDLAGEPKVAAAGGPLWSCRGADAAAVALLLDASIVPERVLLHKIEALRQQCQRDAQAAARKRGREAPPEQAHDERAGDDVCTPLGHRRVRADQRAGNDVWSPADQDLGDAVDDSLGRFLARQLPLDERLKSFLARHSLSEADVVR
eukprot:2561703-Prymnesium_polylepis.1